MLTAEHFNFDPPRFSVSQIRVALSDQYGLTGSLKPLEGERDQNHRLTSFSSDRYVVKISCLNETSSVVGFQTSLLQHISAGAPSISIPRVVETNSGQSIGRITAQDGAVHMLRVLTYVEGQPYATGDPATSAEAFQAGAFLGQVALALSDFSHPAQGQFLVWNMMNGIVADPELWAQAGSDIRNLAPTLLPQFSDQTLPHLEGLRKQVIHNDAHADNLLRLTAAHQPSIGLIDFGDATFAPLVNDVAILCLGFCETAENPVEIAAQAAAGYASVIPLSEPELEIIYDVMLMREVLQVLLFDFKMAQNASNSDFVEKSRPMFMDTTHRLLAIGRTPFVAAFKTACSTRKASA